MGNLHELTLTHASPRHRTGRAWRLAALGLAIAMITAACSSSVKPSASHGTGRPLGTVTIGSVVDINSTDPQDPTFAWEQAIQPLIFDALTRFTKTGGYQVSPDLATSWAISPDHKTYTFRLRSGVRFSDGTPLTAQLVAASIQRALKPATAWFNAFLFAPVSSVTAPNASTVVIKLSRVDSPLLQNLALIEIVDPEPAALKNVKTDAIGTGPYMIAGFAPGNHLDLVRNPHYWGSPAPTPKLDLVKAADPTAAVSDLKTGALQGIGNLGLDTVNAIRSAGGTVLIFPKTSTAMVLTTDDAAPPFNNVKARLGLAYALNRPAMVKAALGGVGTPVTKNLPLPASFIDPSLPNITYNLAKAKTLFRQAGVGPGSKLTFWTVAEQPFYSLEAQILQPALASIGITLKIDAVPVSQWGARIFPPSKAHPWPNIISTDWYSGLPPPYNLYDFNTTSSAGPSEDQWNNAGYAKAVSQIFSAANPTALRQATYRAEAIFQAQVPMEIISLTGIPIATAAGVTGAWVDPGDIPHFESVVAHAGG